MPEAEFGVKVLGEEIADYISREHPDRENWKV